MKNRILDFLGQRFEGIEIILVSVGCLSLVLVSAGIKSAAPLLVISLSSLAIIYFTYAMHPVKAPIYNALSLFGHRMIYQGLSIAALALLFKLRDWNGAGTFAIVAIASIIIFNALPFLKRPYPNESQRYTSTHYVRSILWIALLIGHWLFPV